MSEMSEEPKIKVQDAFVIVESTEFGYYYSIKYKMVYEDNYTIGYSSYNPELVFGWLKDVFDIVDMEECKRTKVDINFGLPVYGLVMKRFEDLEQGEKFIYMYDGSPHLCIKVKDGFGIGAVEVDNGEVLAAENNPYVFTGGVNISGKN